MALSKSLTLIIKRLHKRHFLMAFIGLLLMTVTIMFSRSGSVEKIHIDEAAIAQEYYRSHRGKLNNTVKVACDFPHLDPFSPVAMSYFKKFPTTSCPDGLPTITYFDGKAVRVNKTLKERHLGKSKVQCWYRSVSYKRTVPFVKGDWKGPFSNSIDVEKDTDYVEVECQDSYWHVVSRMHHYPTRQYPNTTIIKTWGSNHLKTNGINFNVLLLGVDALANGLFKRAMPKTRRYLLETLDVVEMNLYNKAGYNTFPNLLATTAGAFRSEIPHNGERDHDRIPYIWKDYKSAGYATQYASDRHDFIDFEKVPTDSYNLPMVNSLMQGKISFDNNCFEDQQEIVLWLNLVLQFAMDAVYSGHQFFSLGMFKRPTHDFPNQASAVDEHYYNFLVKMNEYGLLKNTFFFFFGDHGPVFGDYRMTFEGSVEERAPTMLIHVPTWFKTMYPQFYETLLINANRLTTNFDIHRTLQVLLKLNDPTYSHLQSRRGISLFSEISPERTCDDAEIATHYCLCNGGKKVAEYKLMKKLGEHLVQHINNILASQKDKCATVKVRVINSLINLQGISGGGTTYRIVVTTDPGGAQFEATINYSTHLFFFESIKVLGLVSRINAYRGLSDCVQGDKLLMMYCYCRDLL